MKAKAGHPELLCSTTVGGVVSFAKNQLRGAWGMDGSTATTLQCPRLQCNVLAKPGTENVSISFLIHPLGSTTSHSDIVPH